VESNHGATTALCACALLETGASRQVGRMKRALEWLAAAGMHSVEARALRACVWGTCGRERRKLLGEDLRWLLSTAAHRAGGGRVRPPDRDPGDPFGPAAVCAVAAAARSRLEVPSGYWKLLEQRLRETQNPDGGWGAGRSAHSDGAATAAHLASLLICFDAAFTRRFLAAKANAWQVPIDRARAFLDEAFRADFDPARRSRRDACHYLYQVQRAALAGGYASLGGRDWCALGAARLLADQRGDGSWRYADDLTDTSLAVLFLSAGRTPVAFRKLRYDGLWNTRPHDLARLTEWLSPELCTTAVRWQVVRSDELADGVPVLYISGASAPRFTEAELARLRRFVHRGGLILSVAAGGSNEFSNAMEKVYAKMFPQYGLKLLRLDHPLYHVHYQTRKKRPLLGIPNGVRLLAVHSAHDLSLSWQLNRFATQQEAFQLGANIFFYATGRSLRNLRAGRWPAGGAFQPVGTIRVVRVRHNGNWDPEPLAWERFAILMGNRHRVRVKLSGPIDLAGLDPARWPVAAMTGTAAIPFDPRQGDAVRAYLLGGGTLIVDAAGGNEQFAAAVREQLMSLLPDARWGPVPSAHPIFTAGGRPITKVRYRPSVQGAPRLWGLWVGGRLAAVVSRYDLTAGLAGVRCRDVKGYMPRSAFDIMRNILIYVTGKKVAPAQKPEEAKRH